MYCKNERGDHWAKREQILLIVGILQTNAKQLLILCLANQKVAIVVDDNEVAEKALIVAKDRLKTIK